MSEKLLIVEDEDTLRESLKRVFMRAGYEADVAQDAESALKMLEGRTYDLIITDIILSGITGIELLKKQIGEMYDFDNIIGQSKSISSLIQEVKKISDSKSNVLLLGETGTGKE